MVSEIFKRIDDAFEEVDPDVAEVEVSAGACTIATPVKRSKIIVSPQPPVRQIWLAAAALGIAIHFDWHPEKLEWWDDKNKGYELFSHLRTLVKDMTGLQVEI